MADKIKLVKGDNRPFITLTLTDSTGATIDLSDVNTSVVVYFRATGTTTVLATLTTTKINSGLTGMVKFNFPGTTLNITPGAYEGEIEITFNGEKQTVYDVLKFQLRDQFQ